MRPTSWNRASVPSHAVPNPSKTSRRLSVSSIPSSVSAISGFVACAVFAAIPSEKMRGTVSSRVFVDATSSSCATAPGITAPPPTAPPALRRSTRTSGDGPAAGPNAPKTNPGGAFGALSASSTASRSSAAGR